MSNNKNSDGKTISLKNKTTLTKYSLDAIVDPLIAIAAINTPLLYGAYEFIDNVPEGMPKTIATAVSAFGIFVANVYGSVLYKKLNKSAKNKRKDAKLEVILGRNQKLSKPNIAKTILSSGIISFALTLEPSGQKIDYITDDNTTKVDIVPVNTPEIKRQLKQKRSIKKWKPTTQKKINYYGVADVEDPLFGAMLDVIARYETADYDVMYGGEKFDNFETHPKNSHTKWGIKSDAAGRYQFMGKTFNYLKKIGYFKNGFTPEEQDRAAMYLLTKIRKVNREDLETALDTGNFYPICNKIKNEWTPFRFCKNNFLERNFREAYEAQTNKQKYGINMAYIEDALKVHNGTDM